MDNGNRYASVGDRITAKRQTGERSADFLEYSRKVLANLRNDVDHGLSVDPETIRSIERTISRHERGNREAADLTSRIQDIKAFGRGRQQT